jgi:hypothetical protein
VYDTTHVRRSAIVEMSSPAVNAQLGLRLVASASVLSSVCTVVPCANGIGNASPAGPRRLRQLERLEYLVGEAVLDLLAGHLLEDHAEQHVIRVAVVPALSRAENLADVFEAHVDQFARRPHALEIGEAIFTHASSSV